MKLHYIKLSSTSDLSIKQEFNTVLDNLISRLNSHHIFNRVVKLTVFYSPSELKGAELNGFIKERLFVEFGEKSPSICILAQPPLGINGNFLIEVSYLSKESNYLLEHKKAKGIPYILVKNDLEEHLFVSGLNSNIDNNDMLQHSIAAFELLEDILSTEQYHFNHIVRQWNYIEEIISNNDVDNQHYQIFNDVRTHYYTKNGLTDGYPAATGIGIKEGGVIIEVHACKSNDSAYKSVEIKNPEQIDAFDYSEDVLEGEPCEGFVNKSTPKFARARLLTNKNMYTLLISGTASIHGEETIGLGDIVKQTHVTINNINELFNVTTSGHIETTESLADSADYIRVYIKDASDFQVVSDICNTYFTNSCTVFVEADVCRDNLLVEIEGVVHF